MAIGLNLDRIVINALTLGRGKATGINIYGQVGGTDRRRDRHSGGGFEKLSTVEIHRWTSRWEEGYARI